MVLFLVLASLIDTMMPSSWGHWYWEARPGML